MTTVNEFGTEVVNLPFDPLRGYFGSKVLNIAIDVTANSTSDGTSYPGSFASPVMNLTIDIV